MFSKTPLIPPTVKPDKYAAIRRIPKKIREKDEITLEDYHYFVLDKKQGILLIDVRSKDERDTFSIGGIHLSIDTLEGWQDHGELDVQFAAYLSDKNAPIIFYCKSGTRSYAATLMLKEIGYTNVKSLAGGMDNVQKLNTKSCCTIS